MRYSDLIITNRKALQLKKMLMYGIKKLNIIVGITTYYFS